LPAVALVRGIPLWIAAAATCSGASPLMPPPPHRPRRGKTTAAAVSTPVAAALLFLASLPAVRRSLCNRARGAVGGALAIVTYRSPLRPRRPPLLPTALSSLLAFLARRSAILPARSRASLSTKSGFGTANLLAGRTHTPGRYRGWKRGDGSAQELQGVPGPTPLVHVATFSGGYRTE